jgi:UDP-N-acetyl-D-galactosamine dehydrogenase
VINSGRYVNDSMGFYVAKQTVKKIVAAGKDLSKAKILVMGATFKENVEDIRNSKVADVVKELLSYGVNVEVTDPKADSSHLKDEYGFGLVSNIGTDYDAVIIAVNHQEYANHDEAYFKSILAKDAIIVDLKGVYKGKIKELGYWSL